MASKAALIETVATGVTRVAGSNVAFLIAFGLIVVWVITCPLFRFSPAWQMIINTGTSVITFLMVFLIEKSQNKDSLAIQLKLNELVAAHELASNRLVNVEGTRLRTPTYLIFAVYPAGSFRNASLHSFEQNPYSLPL